MIKKLRWKFVLINMTLIAVMLGIICSFILISTKNSLYQDSMQSLQQAVELSGLQTPDIGFMHDSDSADPDEPEIGDGSFDLLGNDRIQIPYMTVEILSDNTVYVLSNQFFDLEDTDTLLSVVKEVEEADCTSGLISTDGYDMRYLRSESMFGTRVAFVDLTQERSTLTDLVRTLIIVGVLALAVFFVISILLARWAVRPVEKSWKQQRQFISDASHELKTPLAVILSSLDMFREAPDASPVKQQQWLENIEVSSEQMKTLVEELLVLARSDNATTKVNLTTCDLSDIATTSLLMFEPIAFEKGKMMEDSIEENVLVQGDRVLLKRICDIYLDNACKYAEEGSVISVALKSDSKRITLSVYSQGQPLTKEQLTRIFERFCRLDASRTEEGYGLGLSIAVELARIHHGKVWAEASERGNTFCFSMPKGKIEAQTVDWNN